MQVSRITFLSTVWEENSDGWDLDEFWLFPSVDMDRLLVEDSSHSPGSTALESAVTCKLAVDVDSSSSVQTELAERLPTGKPPEYPLSSLRSGESRSSSDTNVDADTGFVICKRRSSMTFCSVLSSCNQPMKSYFSWHQYTIYGCKSFFLLAQFY